MILTTHHHSDHVEANLALKQRFGLKIIGPKNGGGQDPRHRRDRRWRVDVFKFGGEEVSGHLHARPHARPRLLPFPTLKLAVCRRHAVCARLRAVVRRHAGDDVEIAAERCRRCRRETAVYCGHEYTQSNARFALTVDPDNVALKERAAEIDRLRADGKPTLPTTIGRELETNPFLRPHDPAIRRLLGMEDASDEAVFAEIRKRKDNF